jgi:hypothetical protein
MQVTLLFHEPPADFALRADTGERGSAYWGAWRAYMAALGEAGLMRGGQPLEPASRAVAVRVRGGANQVLDGPYAETREQLGGFVTLEVPDMEAAVAWAARAPCAATGGVEVRPVMPMIAG